MAPPTTAVVSSPRWKSYWARSSDFWAAEMNSATSRAICAGCWPPSVRVRMVIEELIERLRRATIGATFNFYRDGAGAAARRERLLAYLEARANAPLLLVGEAAGHRGARVSGIPFTSERQLTGRGAADGSATIVPRELAELGLEEQALCWNVVPTHPHRPARPDTNRRPTRAEVEASRPFLRELARGRRVIAVGPLPGGATGGPQ